ncbi:MAG TPA: dienelactone hydrolase family protein [Alphaproteobacteria bacterium]|nr:dienelactone hydrolase family protein [Alphaproteobacteria bacterium]
MPDIKIKAKDGGTFSAYQSGSGGPGIVLIQEFFGVNKVMRDLADGYAKQGHTVLCPDLFWRQEPGIQITDKTQAEWDKAFSLFKGFDQAKGVEDLIATLAHLRTLPGVKKAGSVGYCLGGQLAYLMSTRSDVDCSVSYYGVGLDGLVGEAKNIKKPLLMHIAEKDKFVPPEAQKKVKDALSKIPHVTIHTYAGQDHAFARVGGEHYDKQAADLANQRTAEFFRKHLA